MHDIADLERRGLPGVFVASAPFVDAAERQSESLGFAAEAVFVEHPIQDRTDEEMRVIASDAVTALIAAVTGPDPSA